MIDARQHDVRWLTVYVDINCKHKSLFLSMKILELSEELPTYFQKYSKWISKFRNVLPGRYGMVTPF